MPRGAGADGRAAAPGGRLRALGLGRGFWAVADQGVVSSGTFVTGILLARSLPQAEYGAYAVVLGVLLFANGIHGALVAYPLSLRGAAADQADLQRLTRGCLGLTAVLGVPLGAGALAAAWAVADSGAAAWAAVALLLWQSQETVRRALMAHLRHREAMWGDALSYLGQAALVGVLAHLGRISLETAFGVMAVTSGLAAVLQAGQVGLRSIAFRAGWRLIGDFWRLGRWILAASVATIFTVQAFPWVLAAFHGLAAAAALQAVGAVLGVTNPVMFGIGNLVVPVVVRARLQGSVGAAERAALWHGAQGGLLLLPYYAAILLWPQSVLWAFYGQGSPYLAFEGVLRLLVASYALGFLGYVLVAFLNGLGDTRSAFLSQLAGALAALLVGLPLAALEGVLGATAGLVVESVAWAACAIWLVRRHTRCSPEGERAGSRHGARSVEPVAGDCAPRPALRLASWSPVEDGGEQLGVHRTREAVPGDRPDV